MLTTIATGTTVEIAPTVQSYRLKTDGSNNASITFALGGVTVWSDACLAANLATPYDGPALPLGGGAAGGLGDPAKKVTVTVAGTGAVAYVYST